MASIVVSLCVDTQNYVVSHMWQPMCTLCTNYPINHNLFLPDPHDQLYCNKITPAYFSCHKTLIHVVGFLQVFWDEY